MLKKHGGKTAAAGWDGDRYAVFEGPKNKLGLVWLSTWDSEDDAREFARGLCRLSNREVGNLGKPAKPIPDSVWRNADDSLYVVERRGRDVAVVEGFTPETTPGLVEAAFRAKQTEVKPREPAKSTAKSDSEKEGNKP